jgi:hypothetical protein
MEGHVEKRGITGIFRITVDAKADETGGVGRIHDPQNSDVV